MTRTGGFRFSWYGLLALCNAANTDLGKLIHAYTGKIVMTFFRENAEVLVIAQCWCTNYPAL